MMALGEATGAQFNYIPYGGGNPTFTAMLSGETDVGALPIANILALKDKFKVLGVFNKTNIFAAQTENAPAVNSVFGTSIPELSSSRSWAVHAEWANANPKQFEFLERTAKEAHASRGVPRRLEEDGQSGRGAGVGRPQDLPRIRRGHGQAGAALREAAHRAGQEVTPARRAAPP